MERLDEVAHASAASVDLQLEFRTCVCEKCDPRGERQEELISRFGGRWDKALREYVGDAQISRVVRMHPGQVAPARWFDDWLGGHLDDNVPDDERIFDVMCSGGRRGGKTAFSMGCAVAYAIAIPESIVWIVVPSDAYYAEPIAYLESVMPKEWFTSLGAPHWTFYLANGSQIVIRSGHTPKRLKQGRCDFAVINEGQAVPTQSYTTLSASIIDKGGLVMTAANPPDVGDPGEWVAELVSGVELGKLVHAEHFFFDPEHNPHIIQSALLAMRDKMDPHTYDVQIRGKFLLPPDSVLYTWDRLKNELPVPEVGAPDVTAAFTRHFEGRAYDDVVGVDVQNFPWTVGVRGRFYANPLAPHDLERALLWGVGEAYIEQGDEIQCATQLHQMGCSFDRTLVVADASCDWQQQERDQTKQRPEFKGKGSMDMFRAVGFKHVVPPDTDMRSNPHIVDRVRAANARIKTKAGERMLFLDPTRCKKTVKSIRGWRTLKSGQPSRNSRNAHGGDALTYIVWRFFPRRTDKTTIDVTAIKRFAGRDRVKGFSA